MISGHTTQYARRLLGIIDAWRLEIGFANILDVGIDCTFDHLLLCHFGYVQIKSFLLVYGAVKTTIIDPNS